MNPISNPGQMMDLQPVIRSQGTRDNDNAALEVFTNITNFDNAQRIAKALAASNLIPKAYQGNIANVLVALEMANRLGASVPMIMQNLFVIQGRPSWSSQFIIAAINSCGRFSSLKFTLIEKGKKTVTYVQSFYDEQTRQKSRKEYTFEIEDWECVASAVEKSSGTIVQGPEVSIEMAVREGWYSKEGSKWQTMPKVMLRYRAAAFFGRFYAPDILMGMSSTDEIEDAQFTEVKPMPELEIPKVSEPVVIENTTEAEIVSVPTPIERTEQKLLLVKTELPVPEIGTPVNMTKAEVEAKFAEVATSKVPVKTNSMRSTAQSPVDVIDDSASGSLFDPGQDNAPDSDEPSLATQLIWDLQMAENLKDFQQRKKGIAESYNTLSKADKDRVAEEANRIKASFEGGSANE
ncbi:MAG: hypothetical protein LCH52_08465 [Bacteroidetes bacterium]|nr:hypothetical protein [Bacteroidota bacterium]